MSEQLGGKSLSDLFKRLVPLARTQRRIKEIANFYLCLVLVFIMGTTTFGGPVIINYDFDGNANDTGTTGAYDGTINATEGDYSFVTNGDNGQALEYVDGGAATSQVDNVSNITWGSKFVLQAKLSKATGSTAQIDIVNDGAVHWYVAADGKVGLSLYDGTNTFHYATTETVVPADGSWVSIQAVVDLTQTSNDKVIKFYNISAPITEEQLLGNYFGDGSDGSLNSTGHVTLPATQDGDMVVANYKDLTLNTGHVLTTNVRCKGMLLFVDGDLTVNGVISMTQRGANVNPTSAGVSATGLRLPFLADGQTDSLSAADLNGCGTAATTAAASFPVLDGNGKVITIQRTGASGAAAKTSEGNGNVGTSGQNGQSGGGGGGGCKSWDTAYGGAGSAGTCFSGGTGGGGDYVGTGGDGAAYGGAGGQGGDYGGSYCSGGGAGNPGGLAAGGNGAEPGVDGTGGLLIIVCSGAVSIGSSGLISANGSNGGGDDSGGGGGSGGGNVVIAHVGGINDTSKIVTIGGTGGAITNNGGAGGNGGAGSVQIVNILPSGMVSLALSSNAISVSGKPSTLTSSSGPVLAKRSDTSDVKFDYVHFRADEDFAEEFDPNEFLAAGGGSYTSADTTVLYEFKASDHDDPITEIKDTYVDDIRGAQNATVVDGANMSIGYDGYGDTLTISKDAGTNACIRGLQLDWGPKMVLEARVWKGSELSGEIDLIKNTSDTALKWYIGSDGYMYLELNGGAASVKSASQVLEAEKWVSCRAVIDLTQADINNAIKFYAFTEAGDVEAEPEEGPTNYFGDGSDDDGTGTMVFSDQSTVNTELNVATADSDMVVKHYKNLTIDGGVAFTPTQRCRGMLLFVDGDLNVNNGSISMTAKGACVDPAAAGVSATGLRLPFLLEGETETLGAADLNGCGTAAATAGAAFPALEGNGKVITIPRTGAAGAAGQTLELDGIAGTAGANGQTGGGGSGGTHGGSNSGAGGDGTCFSGGAGSGGAYQGNSLDASDIGGAGSAGTVSSGGGAGNPGGAGGASASSGSDGTGGLLIVICSGSVNLGASGAISADGAAGGDAGSGYYAGGGSGGGSIVVVHNGGNVNTSQVHAYGGAGGAAAKNGGAGGAGSVQILDLSANTVTPTGPTIPIALDASSTYSGPVTLAPADYEITMLQRTAQFTLKADFIKMRVMGTFATSDDVELHDTTPTYNPAISGAITLNPNEVLKRVINPPSDFSGGQAINPDNVQYDTHPSPESVFHGMFEINFELRTESFDGIMQVGIYIKIPNEDFKKIGEMQIDSNSKPTDDSAWAHRYYWNSRVPHSGDDVHGGWDITDPYRTTGSVQLKFEVQ